ncbi:hypothetical protein M3A49_40805 [Paraburkholderia sp. CNPSo 3076]|uniref:hypothetical protein n=1 Tax=Paraburkholderia sp. CNPSo 3076 TaxID=2940936 RepID=UPI0022542B38|nr:hypothetical protein [Paraburkholderia sp. CNPSo 3076]MCX5545688.1 hypothetical protein [Paraburkholderia sp. CNPSo 3076]
MNGSTGAILGGVQGGLNGALSGGGMGGAMQGLAYSNPYSAAAMAAGQVLSSTLGGPDPNQTSSNAPFNPFTVDNSGWSVNFGDHGSASATANPVSTLAQGLANAGAPNTITGALGDPLVLLAIVAVVLVIAKRK